MAGLKGCSVIFTLFFLSCAEARSLCFMMSAPLNSADWRGKLEMRQEPENEEGYYIDNLYVWASLPGEARLLDEDDNVLETVSFIGQRQELQTSFESTKFFYNIEFSLRGEERDARLWFETVGCESEGLLDAQP
ncbi:uncharacterized protein LOC135498975 [Lineus longissimus]|uniref:uncharacterized protein LOC135498975 n=1 Tax=Lineus longissimus TaxID=88925 RepID=UPI002B4CFAF3